MIKVAWVIILLLTASFPAASSLSCPQLKAAIVNDVRLYFPAEPGMKWIYSGTGNEYAAFWQQVVRRQGNHVQFAIDNGGTRIGTIYEISSDAIIQTLSQEEWYAEDSLFDKQPNRKRTLLKSPLRQGASWQDNEFHYDVASMNALATTPAGTFTGCIKIRIRTADNAGETFEYYAPEVGLVLREYIHDKFRVTSALAARQ